MSNPNPMNEQEPFVTPEPEQPISDQQSQPDYLTIAQPLPGLVTVAGWVFSDPYKVGETVKRKSNWWFPFVIGAVIMVITQLIIWPQMSQMIEKKTRASFAKQESQMSVDQQERAIEMALSASRVSTPLFAALGIPIMGAFSALVWMLIGNLIMGGSAKFSHLFAATIWVNLISVSGSVIRLPMQILRDTFEIPLGPAALLPEGSEGFLHTILSGLDIIYIWQVVATGIVTAAIYGWSKNKGISVSVGIFAIFLLIGAGFSEM
ncbi:MAG: YIP1 family protein [bacterium]|nr:YIP1 family protein [bacterium]